MPQNDRKIPIVFGVTGHRDIRPEDVDALKTSVHGVFSQIKKTYGDTPLSLLSPLAEGADRVVAEVALDLGIELIVPLPMAKKEYERDFCAPGSLDGFRSLLKKAAQTIEMPLPPGVQLEDVQRCKSARDQQYKQAGLFIALHCHILFALWDGKPSDKTGGTAEIVYLRRNGITAADVLLVGSRRDGTSILDPLVAGPVVHVITPRKKEKSQSEKKAFSVEWLYPVKQDGESGQDKKYCDALFSRLNTYNEDVGSLSHRQRQTVVRSADFLFPTDETEKQAAADPSLTALRQRFAIADSLAMINRDRTHKALFWIVGCFVMAFIGFEVFAHLWQKLPPLGAYLAILILAWLAHLWIVRPKDWQGKYEDYRALAEALRVQFFWRLAGLPNNVADYYLQSQSNDLSWVRQSARVCNIGPAPPTPAIEIIADIKRHWIDDQIKFFSERGGTEHDAYGILDTIRLWIYLAGIGIAGALFIYMWSDDHIDQGALHVIIVVMGLAPALAAAITFYLERRAYESHVRQYRVMANLYQRAEAKLGVTIKAGDVVRAQEVLAALGREALTENADWVILHRERRVEPPKGG